jgi:hypothetical protein
MQNIARGLILIAFLAFVAAVIGVLFGTKIVMGIDPESLSRACTNLALVGIGVALVFKE